jgi:hypothetical protein
MRVKRLASRLCEGKREGVKCGCKWSQTNVVWPCRPVADINEQEPALNSIYKPAREKFCFLRLYSARYGHHKVSPASFKLKLTKSSSYRIYFIVSNLSLACLTMPHSSHPVDDIHVPSFDREHGGAFVHRLEDVWLCILKRCFSSPLGY